MAIGVACVLLIMLYVKTELGFDRFHDKRDRIYRLTLSATNPQTQESVQRAIGPYRLAEEMEVDFPDFSIIRFAPQSRELVELDDQQFAEEGLAFVDPEVFQVFHCFNNLADRQITFTLLGDWTLLAALVGVAVLIGIAAGSYPALLLSAFRPVEVFSGKLQQGLKGGLLRQVLVSFQFMTSIFLLIVTGVVYQQLQYCRNMNLGFDKENLVLIPGPPIEIRGQYDQFAERLAANPRIVSSAASSRLPPGSLSSSLRARPEGIPEEKQRGMQTVWTDFDFIETMGFELAAGRSFSRDFSADANTAFILNEAAVKEIGWTNETAIGKGFGSSEIVDWSSGQWQNRDGAVIGVLKDFHFESMKEKIVPTVYFIAPYIIILYGLELRHSH